jgi:hypothetical protein
MTRLSTSLSDVPTLIERVFAATSCTTTGVFPTTHSVNWVIGRLDSQDAARFGSGYAGVDHRAWVFRNAAQRRFVASMIAFRPAALILRFFRAGVVDEAGPDCFLDAAHLFLWAVAILARPAAEIRRLTGVGAVPSGVLGFNIWRSSTIRALSRFFCSSKPAIAAAMISVLSFVAMQVSMIEFGLRQK